MDIPDAPEKFDRHGRVGSQAVCRADTRPRSLRAGRRKDANVAPRQQKTPPRRGSLPVTTHNATPYFARARRLRLSPGCERGNSRAGELSGAARDCGCNHLGSRWPTAPRSARNLDRRAARTGACLSMSIVRARRMATRQEASRCKHAYLKNLRDHHNCYNVGAGLNATPGSGITHNFLSPRRRYEMIRSQILLLLILSLALVFTGCEKQVGSPTTAPDESQQNFSPVPETPPPGQPAQPAQPEEPTNP